MKSAFTFEFCASETVDVVDKALPLTWLAEAMASSPPPDTADVVVVVAVDGVELAVPLVGISLTA